MDIKERIEEVVSKVKSDKSFKKKFSDDPIKAVESLLDVDLPDQQIKAIVDGVKAKVNLDNAGDILGKAKNLFNK